MFKIQQKLTSKPTTTNVWVLLGWVLFLALFLYFIIPKAAFFSDGLPPYFRFQNNFQRAAFVLHIFAGATVYVTGIIQFTPSIRNRYLSFHRKVGKLYILASVVCVLGLFVILPIFMADIFWMKVSHYGNGSLWLLFVILAYVFVRKRNIKMHRRCMISSFICASYFVVIRLVDQFGMPFFRAVTSDEDGAMAVSDFSVWVLPLSFIWVYWIIADKNKEVAIHK